ncbi:MAG: hypothetical protein L3J89_00075 [Gammaproteobacteria bacterium]|nr:hypothetical protein [Gammaproteobacteria bacterium]
MKKVLISLSLCLFAAGCARDGNLKAAVYETVRGINNMHQPASPGENRQNELSYREYEQKRSEAQGGGAQNSDTQGRDVRHREQQQAPEWLINPDQ